MIPLILRSTENNSSEDMPTKFNYCCVCSLCTNLTMPVIVYGEIFSPAVRAVLLTANVIECDINFKEVNLFKGEHLKANYNKVS